MTSDYPSEGIGWPSTQDLQAGQHEGPAMLSFLLGPSADALTRAPSLSERAGRAGGFAPSGRCSPRVQGYSPNGSSLIPDHNPGQARILVLKNTLLSPIGSSCNFFFSLSLSRKVELKKQFSYLRP